MKYIQTPITGCITQNVKPSSIDIKIYEALNQFYTAFNGRDFELMQKNWLCSEAIAMDNPLGGIVRGWDEIKSIYKQIFSGKAVVYVEFYDYTIMKLDGGFCAVGRERGTLEIDGKKLDLAIRTSRVYKIVDGNYRQIHHHGSIENPVLLDQYQKILK